VLETYKKKGGLKKLYEEIKSVPVEDYTIVIDDFRPMAQPGPAKDETAACIEQPPGCGHQ
jgi:hypothetical protein